MRTLTKAALGALAVATVAAGATSEANAAVSFGIGIGGPGYFGGYYGPRPRPYYYDPCYRPYAPAYCGYPVYRGPAFIGGYWYNGPYHYRYRAGRPEFFFRGGWHGGRFGHRR